MSGAATCVLLPWAAAVLAAVLAHHRAVRWLQAAACGATLALVLALWREPPTAGWLGDPLALGAATLTAVAALAAAVGGLPVLGQAAAGEAIAGPGGDPPGAGAVGAAMFAPAAALALLGSVLLGLLADTVAAGWLGVAAATGIASAAPLLRGAGAQAAVRAMAPPAAGALALALLGTMLLSAGGGGRWSLPPPGGSGGPADPAMLALGCVLLLAGYGLAAGLAPLHGWLGAAQEAAPRDLRVLLCAPLPGLALVLLLRVARVAATLPAAGALAGGGTGTLAVAALLGSGLLSVTLAGLSLWRGPAGGGTVRLATLLHGGLVAVAFGLGTGGALFAGLLHLAVSGLARVAAVLAGVDGAGIGDNTGGEGVAAAGGGASGPSSGSLAVLGAAPGGRGWLVLVATLALAGVPPLALFAGEFLLLTEVLARRPLLAVLLVAGVAAAALGLLQRGLHGSAAGPAAGWLAQGAAWGVLAAAMLLGLAMPAGVSDGLTRAAEAFTGG